LRNTAAAVKSVGATEKSISSTERGEWGKGWREGAILVDGGKGSLAIPVVSIQPQSNREAISENGGELAV